MLHCALSFDDAPAIESLDLATEGDRTVDSVRETLERHGITHCVAFVIGERARDHSAVLKRWLASGYELGNHTHSHPRATRVGADAFLDSFARCDALLAELGAFDGNRPRYFRYPFGDRGAPGQDRARIHDACLARGYAIADVSINLHDYCYEAPLADALSTNDLKRATQIGLRYQEHARASFARAARFDLPTTFTHIACGHFGRATVRTLDSLLSALRSSVRWEPMSNAATGAEYLRFNAASTSAAATNQGIIGDALRTKHVTPGRELSRRAARRAARVARRIGLFDQRRLGPLWPHWTE